MSHPFPASRAQRPILLMLGVVLTALVMLALAPGNARAECVSSTPAESITADAAADHIGSAPDIRELRVTLDAECRLKVRPVLAILPLLEWQALVVGFDLDGDEVSDRYVDVFGMDPVLDDGTPLPFVESSGFYVTLDELGVTSSPTEIGMAVDAWYVDPLDPTVAFAGDFHPEVEPNPKPLVRLPVSFSGPPAPPLPLPPAPPAAPPAPATKQVTGCVVPKLKGLSVKKAKAALKKAGCKYKLKGKGRVRSFSPKVGTRTSGTVQVKCKKTRKKKRSRSALLAQVAALR